MAEKQSLWNPAILRQAAFGSFRKLDPRLMVKNPVMLVVEIGSVLTTILLIQGVLAHTAALLSTCRSRCGCGSRCCSPTSPKPWRKGAARPRPTRCARPRARPRPSA